jgi:hypothetical protein
MNLVCTVTAVSLTQIIIIRYQLCLGLQSHVCVAENGRASPVGNIVVDWRTALAQTGVQHYHRLENSIITDWRTAISQTGEQYYHRLENSIITDWRTAISQTGEQHYHRLENSIITDLGCLKKNITLLHCKKTLSHS